MADKVLSWNDFNGRLTRKSGHTANQCPSYGDVISCNSPSIYNQVINWPSGRANNRLILNSFLIQEPIPDDFQPYGITFINNTEHNIVVRNNYFGNRGLLPYERYNVISETMNISFILSAPMGDILASNITIIPHDSSISIEEFQTYVVITINKADSNISNYEITIEGK